MRLSALLCVLFGMIVVNPALAGEGENVLNNPGFEEGEKSPQSWSEGAALEGVKYTWDQEMGFKSKNSACLHKTVQRYFPIAQWYQIVERTGNSTVLEISTQVKAEQATKAIVDLVFLDENNKWISHEWVSYIGAKKAGDPPASHDWKEYSGRVNIPEGTQSIQISLQIYGPGKVWFDDVRAAYAK